MELTRLIALHDAVRTVPLVDRTAWILTDLRGLSTREAAQVMDTHHMDVHRRAERARRHIKEMIA